jgi:hypothetical protein
MNEAKRLAARIVSGESNHAPQHEVVHFQSEQRSEQEQSSPAFFVEDEIRGHEGPEKERMRGLLERCKASSVESNFIAAGNRDSVDGSLKAVGDLVEEVQKVLAGEGGVASAIEGWKMQGLTNDQIRHQAENFLRGAITKFSENITRMNPMDRAGKFSFASAQIIEGSDGLKLMQASIGDARTFVLRDGRLFEVGKQLDNNYWIEKNTKEDANNGEQRFDLIKENNQLNEQRIGHTGNIQVDVQLYTAFPGDRVLVLTGVPDKIDKRSIRESMGVLGPAANAEKIVQERVAQVLQDDFDEHASNIVSAVVMDVKRPIEKATVVVDEIPSVSQKKNEMKKFLSDETLLKTKKREIAVRVAKLLEELSVLKKEGGSAHEIAGTEVLLWNEKGLLAENSLLFARFQQEKTDAEVPLLFEGGERGIQEVDSDGDPTHNTLTVQGYDEASRSYLVQVHGVTGAAIGALQKQDRYRFDLRYRADEEQEKKLRIAINAERAIVRAKQEMGLAERKLSEAKKKFEAMKETEPTRDQAEQSIKGEEALVGKRDEAEAELKRLEDVHADVLAITDQLSRLGERKYASPTKKEQIDDSRRERMDLVYSAGVDSFNMLLDRIQQTKERKQEIERKLAA